MRYLLLSLWLFGSMAQAAPLTNAQTFNAQHTDAFRLGYPGMLMVKGTTDNNAYMLEADPTTGAIPVTATIGSVTITSVPSPTGRTYADSVRLNYASTNVDSTSWVQLIASTAATINALHIQDTGGYAMELGVGGSGSESRVFLFGPGGVSGPVTLLIPAGSRLSIRCAKPTTTVAAGEIDITGLN